MLDLSNDVERKFTDQVDVSGWEIETDTGWHDVSLVLQTVPYDVWRIETVDGYSLEAADDHILYDECYNHVFVKNCVPGTTRIMTRSGPSLVAVVEKLDRPAEHMYDLQVDHPDHRYYTTGILSKNTTSVCGFLLWYIIFHSNKTVALLANKGETAREILGRVRFAYHALPSWLQQGVETWNKGKMELENNSRVIAAATKSGAVRGYSIDILFVDEAAFIDDWDEFYGSVYPTISSADTTKIIQVSTPNGMNHFYRTWIGANAKDPSSWNGFYPILVSWQGVPGRDEKWRQDTLASMNFDQAKFDQEYCIVGSSKITIRDTVTGDTNEVPIMELYEMLGFLELSEES